MKLLVFLVRPDVYEAMENDKGPAEIEMIGLVEVENQDGRAHFDIDQDDFKRLVAEKTGKLTNLQLVSRTVEGETQAVAESLMNEQVYDDNPIFIERLT